jgi:hypothetical protein
MRRPRGGVHCGDRETYPYAKPQHWAAFITWREWNRPDPTTTIRVLVGQPYFVI